MIPFLESSKKCAVYPQRAIIRTFVLFLLILQNVQPISLAYAGDDGEPRVPTSDTDFFYYVHDDHLGSSQLLTEGKTTARHAGLTYQRGEILQRFEYAPFGQETHVLNPNLTFDPSYTGQNYDIDTGLYYYKSRYYNPVLARFIQPDTTVPSATDLQAYNRYSYVRNNPLKYVDPTGHFWGFFRKILGAFIGALIAVIVTIATLGALGVPGVTVGAMIANASFAEMILAGAAGGLVGGAIGGGISGGIRGALLGALFGAIGGAASGGIGFGVAGLEGAVRAGVSAAIIAAGAGLSYVTGGWQGLVFFGAGLVGAYAGSGIGEPIAAKMGRVPGSPKSFGKLYAQATPIDSEDQATEMLRRFGGGFKGPRGQGENYRYVGPSEAAAINEAGTVPNVDVRGNPKNVFYTNEHFT